MTGPEPVHTAFYLPAEVAAMLRCSAWWVKEQARHRRIPFCWIGGGYRFTAEHVAEIGRLFEVRPTEAVDPVVPVRAASRRSSVEPNGETVVQLRARVPRRLQRAAGFRSPAA